MRVPLNPARKSPFESLRTQPKPHFIESDAILASTLQVTQSGGGLDHFAEDEAVAVDEDLAEVLATYQRCTIIIAEYTTRRGG